MLSGRLYSLTKSDSPFPIAPPTLIETILVVRRAGALGTFGALGAAGTGVGAVFLGGGGAFGFADGVPPGGLAGEAGSALRMVRPGACSLVPYPKVARYCSANLSAASRWALALSRWALTMLSASTSPATALGENSLAALECALAALKWVS